MFSNQYVLVIKDCKIFLQNELIIRTEWKLTDWKLTHVEYTLHDYE